MTNQNDTKKLAKLILSASLISNKLDEIKIKRLVNSLKKSRSKKVLPVLLYLEKLIAKKQDQDQLRVESAYKLETSFEKAIKNKFEKMLNKELTIKTIENKELIAGVKIQNADYIWESSVRNNLAQLKESLIND